MKGPDDHYLFKAKGNRGYNYTTDESKARHHLHPLASALQWIGAWRYPEVGQKYLTAGFDKVIGINPCDMHSDRKAQLGQRVWEKQELLMKRENNKVVE